jgi:hypothetical protein
MHHHNQLRYDFLNSFYVPRKNLDTWAPKANQHTTSPNTWILVRETDSKQTGPINQEITV